VKTVLLCLFALSLFASPLFGYEAKEPNDSPIDYNEFVKVSPVAKWFFDTLRADGYVMPEQGSLFKFTDYFSAVPELPPAENDLCFFVLDNKKLIGIVSEVLEDMVVLKIPNIVNDQIVFGTHTNIPVSFDDIHFCLRPHKKNINYQPKGSI
jgi:hypothetical protein